VHLERRTFGIRTRPREAEGKKIPGKSKDHAGREQRPRGLLLGRRLSFGGRGVHLLGKKNAVRGHRKPQPKKVVEIDAESFTKQKNLDQELTMETRKGLT